MIASIEPINSGFAISDPQDPRSLYYLSLRQRFGKLLHDASVSLRRQGEENTVDAVHTLVRWPPQKLLLCHDFPSSRYSPYVHIFWNMETAKTGYLSTIPSDFLTTEIRPVITSSWTVTRLSSATPGNIQGRRSGQERFLYGVRGECIIVYYIRPQMHILQKDSIMQLG